MINMFSSVNVNVEDGNLGRSTVEGRGVQVTIGVSNVKSTVPLLITNHSVDLLPVKSVIN